MSNDYPAKLRGMTDVELDETESWLYAFLAQPANDLGERMERMRTLTLLEDLANERVRRRLGGLPPRE